MVNKALLIQKIAELVKDKKIDGITGIIDQSNMQGIRVSIELRRDVNANVILNQLYKHTQLQDTFGVNMLALVNNEPKVLNLHQMLTYYLEHQEEVVTRRTRYELNKAQETRYTKSHIYKKVFGIAACVIAIIGITIVLMFKPQSVSQPHVSDSRR